MRQVLQDLRYALRQLRKRPGFSVPAILALALGIGASTAVFSLVYNVLLKPLPFKNPDRLVMVWQSDSPGGPKRELVTPANFSDLRAQADSFQDLAAFVSANDLKLPGEGGYERASQTYVTPRFFAVLGNEPLIGRIFNRREETDRGYPTAIISYSLWERRFNRDPKIIGQHIVVDDYEQRAHTIIGVMPAGFNFPSGTDLWLPSAFFGWQFPVPPPDSMDRCCSWLQVIGRLKPGVNVERAQTQISTIARTIAARHPDKESLRGLSIVPLYEQLVASHRRLLLFLLSAVGCLMLIACANVAGLLFARFSSQRQELLIRAALGASRPRLIGQLLAESALLSAIGGVIGLALANAGVRTLVVVFGPTIPRASDAATISIGMLAFSIALCVAVAMISGLAPALMYSNEAGRCGLQKAGHGYVVEFPALKFRGASVVVQFALAVSLVTAAGLFLRTFDNLHQVDPGFKTDHISATTFDLTSARMGDQGRRRAFLSHLLERIQALPGVTSAGAVSNAPLTGDTYLDQPITLEGGSLNLASQSAVVSPSAATAGYFHTMGISLNAGRMFADSDDATHPMVALVNETAARWYWGKQNAVGHRFFMGEDGNRTPVEIIGVVGDVRSVGLEVSSRPEVYFSYKQFPVYDTTLVVRSQKDIVGLDASIRREAAALNQGMLIIRDKTMDQIVADSTRQTQFRALLMTIFSLAALVIAAIGMYGMMSYSVAHRTHEIGVRTALGAHPRDIMRLVIREGATVVLTGLVIGVLMSVALTRFMESLLYGVAANDPLTLLMVSALLASVAFTACFVPARRAARVDPVVALRYE